MTRANISNLMNEGVRINCKAVTTNCFAVLGLIFGVSTAIEKPKGYIE